MSLLCFKKILVAWLCSTGCWLLLCPLVNAATNKYDLSFKQWGEFYFPGQDWHWWKSQGEAESTLNPNARSYCGAIGIMQLMPATASGLKVNPYDPASNIQGGIKYDAQMYKFWNKIPDADQRRDFGFGSYNAGAGNIQKAYKIDNNPTWDSVAANLVKITGKHSTETIEYIKHIHAFYMQHN